MRRYALPLCLGAVLVSCSGCGKDYYPRRLLVHDTTPGKLHLRMAGSPEDLVKSLKIDIHRRFPVAGDIEIDVWVIKARPSERTAGEAAVKSRATVVMLHGLGESKARFLDLGRRLAKRGFDVILPDLRAHGASTGQYVTYGAWERVDVKTVVDELIAEKTVNPRVYVFGVSLGGSTAIQYAAIDQGKRVRGIVAVAPFRDAASICRRRLPFWVRKEKFQQFLQRAGHEELGNFNPEDASALKAVAVLACPILLIHGRLDTTVPYEHSKALFEAARKPKRLITVNWAGHSTIFLGREKWFAGWIDELDTVAMNFEKKLVVEPTTKPAPKAPPLKPPPPKPPVPKFPATKPAAPTTRKAPTTKPTVPKPPPPPPTDIPIRIFPPRTRPATRPTVPTQPATQPAVPKPPPPPPTDIPIRIFPPRTQPTTQPTVPTQPAVRAPTTQPAAPTLPSLIDILGRPTRQPKGPATPQPAPPKPPTVPGPTTQARPQTPHTRTRGPAHHTRALTPAPPGRTTGKGGRSTN